MILNALRCGNFTSSEIFALQTLSRDGKGFGAPALTYINQTNMERRLGRSLTTEVDAKPITWGKLLERRAFEILGLEYSLTSTDTIRHQAFDFWSGSKDGIKMDDGKTVIDIKCPLTLDSFCGLVDPLYEGLTGIEAMNAIREGWKDDNGFQRPAHKSGERYYWQLVSNSILDNTQYAELIVYVPYKSELDEIRQMAQDVEGEQMHKHYWISMARDTDLPYLLDDGYYKNINTIRFEVPIADKILLTNNVKKAGTMLIPRKRAALPSIDKEALEYTSVENIPFIKL